MYNYINNKILDLRQKIIQTELQSALSLNSYLASQCCCSMANTQNKLNSSIANQYNCLNTSLLNNSLYNIYCYGGIGNQLLYSTEKKVPKKKTLEDLEYELFPDNPIRDYINKELERIEEKYRKIEEALGGS